MKTGKESRVFFGVGDAAALLRAGAAKNRPPRRRRTAPDDCVGNAEDDNGGSSAPLVQFEEVEEGSEDEGAQDGAATRQAGEAEDDDEAGEKEEEGYLFVAPSHRKHHEAAATEGANDRASGDDGRGATADGKSHGLDLLSLQDLVRETKSTEKMLSLGKDIEEDGSDAGSDQQEDTKDARVGGNGTVGTTTESASSAPVSVAVKVFFTALDQFSNRVDYVVGDPR